MTLYYNSKTRKPHPWIVITPAALPVLLVVLVVVFGRQQMEKQMEEERRRSNVDIFDKF